MKKNYIVKVTGLLIVFILIVFGATAQQTGRIAGKVTDKKTGETLIGLSVKVEGANKGLSTDVEGRYNIGGLAAGRYTLTFSYVGYQTKKVSDIAVRAGAVTTMDVVMDEAGGQQLEQVVINVSAKRESVGALYAAQKASVRVSDGISAEQIRRSPDRNTGEVLRRVSGASIQDNKFVVIRGLSDRYNSTLLNNTPLPSTEPDRKAFSFDVVPANLIDQIVVNKTAAADLPGDFAGGVIQMKTKDFPDQRTISFNYSVGYNSASTFKAFRGGERGNLDFLGFDNGSRALPSSFPSNRTKFSNLPFAQRVELGKDFKNTWGVKGLGSALPSQSLQVTYGNSFQRENQDKVGVLLSLSYRDGMNINDQRRADIEAIGDESFDYNDKIYKHSVNLGGLANFSYTFNSSKISLKNIYNRVFEDSYMDRTGMVLENPSSDVTNSQIQLIQKSLLNSLLEGEHSFAGKQKLDWTLSLSASQQNQPDLRRLYYSRDLGTDNPFAANVNIGSTSTKNSGRFYSDLKDYIYGGSVNYNIPFKWRSFNQNLKVGIWSQYKTRDFSARQMGYKRDPNEETEWYLRLPQDEIFAPENISASGFYIDEITLPSDKYDANGFLNAGYVMFTNELNPKIKVNWGMRVESYIENLHGYDTNNRPADVDNDYLDFLPSVNLIYSTTEKTNVRASFSSTVARAEFRELAPFAFYDFETNNTVQGNNDLKRSRINNYDLRIEHYPTSGQIVSLSVFYKDFSDAIEQVFNAGSTAASKTASYQNATKAYVYGAELELRHKLSFLGSSQFFNNLSFYTNLALMKSDVNLDRNELANINDSRPLQGQSPYLVNAGFQYNDNKWGFNALYNRIGKRISIVGFGRYENGSFTPDYPDIYENPRDVIDLQISRKAFKNKGEIKLSVSDLLNQKAILYQDSNNDKKYSSDDQIIRSIKYGTTFNLSVGYNF